MIRIGGLRANPYRGVVYGLNRGLTTDKDTILQPKIVACTALGAGSGAIIGIFYTALDRTVQFGEFVIQLRRRAYLFCSTSK